MNTAMKLLCKQEGLDPASTGNDLPDVLCRLTGFHVTDIQQHLRKLVQELEELHLRGRDRIDRAGRDFVMSWLKPSASDPAEAEQLIVVCALPPRASGRRTLPVSPARPPTRPPTPLPADEHAGDPARELLDVATDITFVAPGASGRSSRSLPVMEDPPRHEPTQPMFKVAPDEPP
jgi:hypothetical protein